MTWSLFDYDLAELFPTMLEDDGIELCEGGCGFPRSFCNCDAPWPIGNG